MTEPRPDRCIVIIPAYNESQNLAMIVARLRAAQPQVDVLIVDDASPDGTGDLADQLAEQDEAIQVVHGFDKSGLGAAYLAGFSWALERDYDVLVQMDADGSHQPEQLARLLGAIQTTDVVIGSRWVPGGSISNWPLSRELLSRAGNAYIRAMLGLRLRDVTAGFRAYRAEALRQIDLGGVESLGFCFQTDLTRRAVQAGLTVIEVPIDFVERERGESKLNMQIMRESLAKITSWGVRDRTRQVDRIVRRLRPDVRRHASKTVR